jgi:hypothetical protein
MTPEEKELLNRIAKTVDENNIMLHKIRSSMRWASVWRWIYWIVIIGVSVGAFYYIQPYLDTLVNKYTGAQNGVSSFQNLMKSYTP